MTICSKSTSILFGALLLGIGMIFSNQSAAEVVIQVGIATPQAGESPDNIERLRERAIRNAMELAVMQVAGVDISSERSGVDSSRDTITNISGEIKMQQRQSASFHTGAKTKTTGNVKVLQIIKEWQEGSQYFTKLKLEVVDEKELLTSSEIGTLWERIGKPPIGMRVNLDRNLKNALPGKTMQNYLQDNLSRNKLQINTAKPGTERFDIQIKQTFKNTVIEEMGTYKTHCELSFSIIDNETQRSLADFRSAHGPDAGFDERQAEERCTKAIARAFSEKLLKEFAIIFNSEWNNGKDYRVRISELPGEYASKASELIGNAFQVTASEMKRFNDGLLAVNVAYKGKDIELTNAIKSAFFEAGLQIRLASMNGNQIEFIWLGIDE